jgi:FMN phosphatase YigB (HAD superfamily)
MPAAEIIPPNVVVFDIGKVLLDFDYSIAARRIAARSRVPQDHIRVFIDHSPLLFRYETGLMTTDEFFAEVCRITGFAGTRDEFSESFADIFVPIPPMVALHATLREHGFSTFIFSNTNDLAVSHIRRRFPFFAHFDGYILSYQHGAMKPDPKLYAVVERETRCRKGEILYLDDRPENIAAGAARGWQTLLQESPEKTRAALNALGLPIPAPEPPW